MYNRTRIARGAGTAIAVWTALTLVVMSTGVAYALPLAGVGGFFVTATDVQADSAVIYPGVSDTEEAGRYPQATVELENPQIGNLGIRKTFDMSDYTVGTLNGSLQLLLAAPGTATSDRVLTKASYVFSPNAAFDEFEVADRDKAAASDRYLVWSNDTASFSRRAGEPAITIRTHYLVADRITLSDGLVAYVCYDADGDGTYEVTPTDADGNPVCVNIEDP